MFTSLKVMRRDPTMPTSTDIDTRVAKILEQALGIDECVVKPVVELHHAEARWAPRIRPSADHPLLPRGPAHSGRVYTYMILFSPQIGTDRSRPVRIASSVTLPAPKGLRRSRSERTSDVKVR
jgi:hypothetical protein